MIMNPFTTLNRALHPFQGFVTVMLVLFVCIIVYVLLRNKPIEESTLLALLII